MFFKKAQNALKHVKTQKHFFFTLEIFVFWAYRRDIRRNMKFCQVSEHFVWLKTKFVSKFISCSVKSKYAIKISQSDVADAPCLKH